MALLAALLRLSIALPVRSTNLLKTCQQSQSVYPTAVNAFAAARNAQPMHQHDARAVQVGGVHSDNSTFHEACKAQQRHKTVVSSTPHQFASQSSLVHSVKYTLQKLWSFRLNALPHGSIGPLAAPGASDPAHAPQLPFLSADALFSLKCCHINTIGNSYSHASNHQFCASFHGMSDSRQSVH